jgi:hypothetical protein
MVGSIEIAYSPPPFEEIYGDHRRYLHRALDIYRPGYLDFYIAPKRAAERESREEKGRPEMPFTEIVGFGDGHHLRVTPEVARGKCFPGRFKIERKGIKRVRSFSTTWLGWSSTNLLLRRSRASDAMEIESLEELRKVMQRKGES